MYRATSIAFIFNIKKSDKARGNHMARVGKQTRSLRPKREERKRAWEVASNEGLTPLSSRRAKPPLGVWYLLKFVTTELKPRWFYYPIATDLKSSLIEEKNVCEEHCTYLHRSGKEHC